MKNTFITAAVLAITASTASAELNYANAFAKYHDLDAGGASADLSVFGGALEFSAGDWTLSGELGVFDLEGTPSLNTLSLGGEYAFTNGLSLGLDHARVSVDGLALDLDITSVYGYYKFGDYALGLSIGDGSELTDPVVSIFGSWDVTPTGRVGFDIMKIENETLVAGYADYEAEKFSVGATLLSTEGFDVFAVSGSYEVYNNLSVIGSLGRVDLLGQDLNSVSLGLEYEFTPGASAELSLGRLSAGGGNDIDVVSFGLQYELGRRTTSRRSLTNIINQATGNIVGLSSF